MNVVYISILVILVLFSLYGLFVGVFSDASKFINTTYSSKIISNRIIKIVVACGIVIGSMASGGMMNVARFGFFHPQYFDFREVIMLYAGVMLSYVLLLDVFSTVRLPISTSVVFVFCFLGAVIAASIVKINAESYYTIDDTGLLMNSGRAMLIIFAILISIVAAFLLGTIVMYLTRLLFSFRYKSTFDNFGFLWCGLSLAVVAVLLFFGGAKQWMHTDTSGIFSDIYAWITVHKGVIFLIFWCVGSLIMKIVQILGGNMLKITVMAGVFFLAAAFASNDLVNFIGIPIAGFDAYHIMLASGGDYDSNMARLVMPADVNYWLLLLAGIVMAVSAIFSKEKKWNGNFDSGISNREKEEERFGSTMFSRIIVSSSLKVNNWIEDHMPRKLNRFLKNRFAPLTDVTEEGPEELDLIRVTVNLLCASILIWIGTVLELPFSTTYIIFMVVMGTSLADKTWNRTSAVYRITGFTTVLSGWFLTALTACIISIVMTLLLFIGGVYAVFIMTILCILVVIRNMKVKRDNVTKTLNRSKDKEKSGDVLFEIADEICDILNQTAAIYQTTIRAILSEDRRTLREMLRESNELYYSSREKKYELLPMLQRLQEHEVDTGQYYVQIVDYISEMTKSLLHITRPCFEHVDNNHRGMSEEQVSDLLSINVEVEKLFKKINSMLISNDFSELDRVFEMRDRIFEIISQAVKNQLRRIQMKTTGTKASLLYLTILNETKTMVLQSRNLIKSQSYFVETKSRK